MAEIQLETLTEKEIGERYQLSKTKVGTLTRDPRFPPELRTVAGPKGARIWSANAVENFINKKPPIEWWRYLKDRTHDTKDVPE